eukprot:CAMPEP_0197522592 /NCGR_PEP_ID=MMETSP1318-20131121/7711_1 /TAXON_ID=552666 /ORGANISM="Partenskyella glossopodia, Strain RCC365" /LENGTH=1094 /DNA_ID=CAMNT_0043075011 /DNA_START=104 /DNA_END=3388 /DNA_ORIENTATION=+
MSDDDDIDFNLPKGRFGGGAPSKLGKLFAMDDQYSLTGNTSLSYQAPSRKKKNNALPQAPTEQKASTQMIHACYAVVLLYRKESPTQAQNLGSLMITLIKLPNSGPYRMVLLQAQTKKPVMQLAISPNFRAETVPNNYAQFYDAQGNRFAAYFGKDEKGSEVRSQFMQALTQARHAEEARTGGFNKILLADLKLGQDTPVAENDSVNIAYELFLPNTPDYPKTAGNAVVSVPKTKFKIGGADSKVIQGLDKGVQGMRKGGVRFLVVPPNLAYGERESTAIPRNSTLLIKLTLNKIKYAQKSPKAAAAAAAAAASTGTEAAAPQAGSGTASAPDFIASDKFQGERPGYVFMAAKKGTGYYKDEHSTFSAAASGGEEEDATRRRKSSLKERMKALASAGGFSPLILANQTAGKNEAPAAAGPAPKQEELVQPSEAKVAGTQPVGSGAGDAASKETESSSVAGAQSVMSASTPQGTRMAPSSWQGQQAGYMQNPMQQGYPQPMGMQRYSVMPTQMNQMPTQMNQMGQIQPIQPGSGVGGGGSTFEMQYMLRKMQEKLDSIQSSLGSTVMPVGDSGAAVSRAQVLGALQQLIDERDKLKDEDNKRQRKASLLQGKLNEIHEKNQKYMAEVSRLQEERFAAVRQNTQESNSKILELQEDKQRMMMEVNELKMKLAQKDHSVKMLEQEKQITMDLTQKVTQDKLDAEKQAMEAKAALESAKASLDAAKAKEIAAREEANAARKDGEAYQAQIKSLKEDLGNAQRDLATAKASEGSAEDLEAERKAVEAKAKDFEAKWKAAEEQLSKIKEQEAEDGERAKESAGQLQEKLSAEKELNSKLEVKLKGMEQKCAEMAEALDAAKVETQSAREAQASSRKKIIDASKAKIDKLKAQMKAKMQSVNAELKVAQEETVSARKAAAAAAATSKGGDKKAFVKEFYKIASKEFGAQIASKGITMDEAAFSVKGAVDIVKKALRVFAASGRRATVNPNAAAAVAAESSGNNAKDEGSLPAVDGEGETTGEKPEPTSQENNDGTHSEATEDKDSSAEKVDVVEKDDDGGEAVAPVKNGKNEGCKDDDDAVKKDDESEESKKDDASLKVEL